jgi:Na+:H+ antiporter, NhaA family
LGLKPFSSIEAFLTGEAAAGLLLMAAAALALGAANSPLAAAYAAFI